MIICAMTEGNENWIDSRE